jgi:hypothetical protein
MVNLKTREMRKLFLVSVFLLGYAQIFAGGGWSSGKNKGYFKLGQSIIVADQYFTPAGDVIPITTIGQYITYGFGEYGLSDRLDVTLYAPFFSRATLNQLNDLKGEVITQGDQLNSIGDIDVSLKYGLIQNKPIVVSTSITLGIPTGNPSGGVTSGLQTGDGEFNQMLRMDVSRSFPKFYTSAYVGYNHRTKDFSDEFRYGMEVGKPYGNWYFIFRTYGIKPLGTDGQPVPDQVNGLFGNRIEYLAFTPEVNYQVSEHFGLSASVGGAYYGKRVLANPNYGFGVFYKL